MRHTQSYLTSITDASAANATETTTTAATPPVQSPLQNDAPLNPLGPAPTLTEHVRNSTMGISPAFYVYTIKAWRVISGYIAIIVTLLWASQAINYTLNLTGLGYNLWARALLESSAFSLGLITPLVWFFSSLALSSCALLLWDIVRCTATCTLPA